MYVIYILLSVFADCCFIWTGSYMYVLAIGIFDLQYYDLINFYQILLTFGPATIGIIFYILSIAIYRKWVIKKAIAQALKVGLLMLPSILISILSVGFILLDYESRLDVYYIVPAYIVLFIMGKLAGIAYMIYFTHHRQLTGVVE